MTKRSTNAQVNLHHFPVDCFTFVAACFCRTLHWPRAVSGWPNRRNTALVNSMYRFNSDTSHTQRRLVFMTRVLVGSLRRFHCQLAGVIVSTRRVCQHEKLCDLIVPLHLILTPPPVLTEWQTLVVLLLCPTDCHSWVVAFVRSYLSYMSSLHLSIYLNFLHKVYRIYPGVDYSIGICWTFSEWYVSVIQYAIAIAVVLTDT